MLLCVLFQLVLPFTPNSRRYLVPKHGNIGVERGSSSSDNSAPAAAVNVSSTVASEVETVEDHEVPSALKLPDRKMNLIWCDRDICKDVVRERVVGEHNQIILNGPATGQVAYRWSSPASSDKLPASKSVALSSVLLLVKPNDENLVKKAADVVPQLTESGIKVLLAPDLAAKLKYYYGVDDDELIGLFESPKDPNGRKTRYVDDDEESWVQDMYTEPFPDLVCTLGGDGVLIHASMLFQGSVPPIISIAGGSLGFLTPFAESEMVDAVQVALGMVKGQLPGDSISSSTSSSSSDTSDGSNVFPPNMEHYPYEPLVKAPHLGSTPKLAFGMGDIICMTIRMRLDCRIVSPEGKVRARYNVLNEVVVDRGSSPYLAALECFCDDVHLTTVQADGVIFAT